MVRITPFCSQRRPEVTAGVAMQIRPAQALEPPRDGDVLHQRQVGKAADRFERFTGDEDRLVAGGDAGQARAPIDHAGDDGEAADGVRQCAGRSGPRRGGPTPHRSGGRRLSGSAVSACRKRSASPVPSAAPAFIGAPRPRGTVMTRSANGSASCAVPSWLPPSATMISAPRARNGASACNAATMIAASLSTGSDDGQPTHGVRHATGLWGGSVAVPHSASNDE